MYGITGGIVRAATEGGAGRDAAEENTVPGEDVAGYVGWVTGFVYVATWAERAKEGTVRGATEGDPVRGAAEGSTVPGVVIAGYVGWVTGAVCGATGTVRSTGDTVCGATAGGGAIVAAESECGTVGAIHKPKRSRWRSTAAIAAAVTASTICLREGAEAASEPCTVLDIAKSCTVLDIGAREGRRCVTRGWPKNSRWKRWCITISFRSMEYNRGYLPSIAFRPPGVRRGVAIRAREGCPFGVPSATGGFLAAALAGGG